MWVKCVICTVNVKFLGLECCKDVTIVRNSPLASILHILQLFNHRNMTLNTLLNAINWEKILHFYMHL